MKSCPTNAVQSSKIHNGFDMAGFRFQTRQMSLSHTCSIGFKSGNKLGQGRPAMHVLLIFVFLDDAVTVQSCNVISEHNVLAIYTSGACSKIMKLFTLWHPMHTFA